MICIARWFFVVGRACPPTATGKCFVTVRGWWPSAVAGIAGFSGIRAYLVEGQARTTTWGNDSATGIYEEPKKTSIMPTN